MECAVCVIAKLTAFVIPVPTLDEILLQKMLFDYSDTLYDIILERGDGMIYDEMYSSFTADDVGVFEGIFDMYIIANKCALEASQKLALDSNVGDLNYITAKYADFNYDSLIKEVISEISAIPVSERQYKYYDSWFISEGTTFDYPTNEIENGKLYLCQNAFSGNLTVGYKVDLTVPEEKSITIDGNVTTNGNSSVTNNDSLHITGSYRTEGTLTNNGSLLVYTCGKTDKSLYNLFRLRKRNAPHNRRTHFRRMDSNSRTHLCASRRTAKKLVIVRCLRNRGDSRYGRTHLWRMGKRY